MSPKTKGKVKKAKGATSTAQALKKSKQTNRVHVSTEDEGEPLTDDEVSLTQENMAQQMTSMMDLFINLSHWVKVSETHERT